MSVNKAILVGRLGHPPSMRKSDSGSSVCKFNLATEHSQKVGNEWEKRTTWHQIVCFGKTADNCGKYLDKGSSVFIEGRIDNGKYEKDGVVKYYSQVIAENVRFLSSKADTQEADNLDDDKGWEK